MGHIADTCKMHGVLVAVDENTITVHLQRCVAGAHTECASHQDDNDDENNSEHGRNKNGYPFFKRASSLSAAGETFLLLFLAVGDNAICEDTPNGHDECPNNTCDAYPSFLEPDAWDCKDDDHVNSQEDSNDSSRDTKAFGRCDEEYSHDEKITQGKTGVGEVEETRSTCMKPWW